MTKLTLSVCVTAFALQAVAQQTTDTVKTNTLNEVVVESEMQKTTPTASIYTPSVKQKNASQNATDLLRFMSIPEINISQSDAVTDITGAPVEVYINYLKASPEDMSGMRTADVRRVEYLEFPTDPRFHGAPRVINFIVHEYEYGGYTKLSAKEYLLIGFSSDASIFSKFAYKKMTFDVYGGARNFNMHHLGSSLESTYKLKDESGEIYNLSRNERLKSSHKKYNSYPVTFRATYNTRDIQIRNTVGFTHSGYPLDNMSGTLEYAPDTLWGYDYTHNTNNRNNSVSYSGSYFFSMPNDFALDVTPRFAYTHRNQYMDYYVTKQTDKEDMNDIHRHAREDAYYYRTDISLTKYIGKKHTFLVEIDGGEYINFLTYTGTDNYRDRFYSPFIGVGAGYNFKTSKISLNTDFGVMWEGDDINSYKTNDVYPYLHINFRYAFNSKNSVSAWFQYATNSSGISAKSDDILQNNEVMYVTGNPDLGNARHTTFSLTYTWMPSNSFSMSAYGRYFGLYDRQFITYSPYLDGKALIREYVNSGDYLNGQFGVSINWKLFDNNLQFYTNPKLELIKSTGIFDKSITAFSCSARLTYYLDNVYFQLYYDSPHKSTNYNSPEITRYNRNYYTLTAGWSNSNWNLRLAACNLFNKGWESSITDIYSPYYNATQTDFGTQYHAFLSVSATYTFGYGKKVKVGNEVGAQGTAGSAIMQ